MADSAFLSRLPIRGAVATSSGSPDAFKVPVLNADGKLDASLLADKVIYEVADLAAMLALPNLSVGDLALRLDTRSLCLLTELPSNVESNWRSLGTGINYPVTSVAGKTGDVTLTTEDISGLTEDLAGLQPAGDYVTSEDPRLTNSRTPTNHAASHAAGGVDAITPTSIGAANRTHTHTVSQITDFPVLGTAAGLNAPLIGDATASQVVLGNDSRLAAVDNKLDKSSVGEANGVAGLGSDGKVPLSQLPSGIGGGGTTVDLQVADGYIQWQHVGDSSWTNLVEISSLTSTISVGQTTTVSPETPAQVVNTGTSSAAVLDFSIPRGIPGLDGAFELDEEGNLIPTSGEFSTWGLSEGTFHLDENGDLTPTDVIVPPGGGGMVGYKLNAATTNNTATVMTYEGVASPDALIPGQAVQFRALVIGHNRGYDTVSFWVIDGGLQRSFSGNSVSLGTPIVTRKGASWGAGVTVTVALDPQTFVPQITIAGAANTPINWAANISINNTEITTEVPLISGCMDPSADNYNPAAQVSDGSCTYNNATSEMFVPVVVNSQVNSLTATLSGQSMFPAFNPSVYDYAIKTGLGDWANVTVTVTINGTAQQVKAQTNRLIQIKAQGNTYYIRVLNGAVSASTPQIVFGPTASAPAGYWLYAWNNYYIVANENGVPLWYIQSPLAAPFSLHGGGMNRMAGNNNTNQKVIFEVRYGAPYVRIVSSTLGYPDIHEIRDLVGPTSDPSDGSNRAGHALIQVYGEDAPDFKIEEQDENGNVTWSWLSEDHFVNTGGSAFHINSLDVHPITGNIVVSSRHMSCVFEIDYGTKQINWVIQGQYPLSAPFVNYAKPATLATAKILNILGEPVGWHGTSGNHDARYHIDLKETDNLIVSVYDDGTFAPVPHARGVIYEIDLVNNTATNISSTMLVDQGTDGCCGSYTVFRNPDGVVSHAFGSNNFYPSAIEYIGDITTDVREEVYSWTPGGGMYRCVKCPNTHFTPQLLRSCWTQQTQPPAFNPDNGGGGGTTNTLLNGIQAYWNMDEDSGDRIDSVQGLHITEVNGPVYSTNGVNGKAAAITNGDAAWLALPAGICDIGTGEKSFSIWFKVEQADIGYQFIWQQGNTSDLQDMCIVYIEGNSTLNSLFVTSSDNHWALNLGNNIIPEAGVWHHFVGTFSGSQYTAYYDGSQIAQFGYSGSISTDNTQYTLGHYNAFPNGIGGSSPFNGAIDNVGIWNRTLTQAEVTALYSGGAGLAYPFNTPPLLRGIKAYWKLNNDGNGGVDVADATGNGYTLTNNGGAALAQGKILDGAAFDWTQNQYLSNDSISITGNYTVSMWVKFNSMAANNGYPSIYALGYAGGTRINPSGTPSANCSYYDNSIGGGPAGTFNWNVGEWDNYVLVCDNSTGTITTYLNGNLNSTNTTGNVYNWTGFAIGEQGAFNTPDATIDEVGVWNRMLSSTEISTLYGGGKGIAYPFDENPLLNSILSYWKLDDNGSGGVSLVDSTASGNTLTNNNNVTLGTGKISGDAVFNGNNGLTLPNANIANFSSSPNYSVSFWVKTTTVQEFIGQWASGGSWCVTSEGGVANVLMYNGNGSVAVSSNVAITDGNWHHVVLVVDTVGQTVDLYVDNDHTSGTFTYNSAFTNRGLYIGNVDQQYGFHWSGQIDELGLWTRALTSSEVSSIYANGVGLTYPFETNTLLVGINAYWKLDSDGSGGVALTDSTGNNFGLTKYGEVTSGDGIVAEGAVFSGYGSLSTSSTGVPQNSDFSVSAWFSVTGNDGSGPHVLGAPFQTNILFQLSSDGYWGAGCPLNGFMLLDNNLAPLDGTWKHLVYVKTGTTYSLYVDGVIVDSINSNVTCGGNVFYIGGGEFNQYFFSGTIDEVGIWNRALTSSEITKLYAEGQGLSYPFIANPLLENIEAYWTLNDSSWEDSSGKGHTLTKVGQVNVGGGVIKNCGTFHGAGRLENELFNIPAGSFTMTLWVKLNNSSSFQEIISKWSGGLSGSQFVITYNESTQNQLLFRVRTSNGQTTPLSYDNVVAGTWYFIAMSWDQTGNNFSVKINNEPAITESWSGTLDSGSGTTFMVGAGESDGRFPADASIDEIGIWSRVLSASELSLLYFGGKGLSYPFTFDPLLLEVEGYWKLDNDGSGGVSLADSSGNGYTLTNIGNTGLGEGIVNGAAAFSSAGGKALSKTGLSITGSWSASWWVNAKTDSYSSNYPSAICFSQGAPGSTSNVIVHALGDHDSHSNWIYSGYDNANLGQFQVTELNNWYHYVLVNDSSSGLTWYINGEAIVANQNPGLNRDWDTLEIGRNAAPFYSATDCNIDEVGIWKRALSTAEVVSLYNNGKGKSYPFNDSYELSDKLKAYWELDNDGSGGVSLLDSTGNGYTLANNGDIQLATGKIGGSANLANTSQNFSVTGPSLGNNASISFWFNSSQAYTNQNLIGQWNPEYVWLICCQGSSLTFIAGQSLTAFSNNSFDGLWHHYVVSINDGIASIYTDGAFVTSVNVGNIYSTNPLYIGYEPIDGMVGLIDEIGIWSRGLTSNEITALYNNGAGLAYPLKPNKLKTGIKAYWKLDNAGDGTASLVDSSGNNNTLILHGSQPAITSGIIGDGVVGNGSSYYSSTNGLDFSGDFSINYWCNVSSGGVARFDGTIGVGIALDASSTSICFGKTEIYNAICPTVNFNSGWHMVTGVRSGNTVTVYADGQVIGTANDSTDFSTPIGIFAQQGGGHVGDSTNAAIDEIGVWNRALSLEEINELYSAGSGISYPFTLVSGLEGYWGLDDNGSGGVDLTDTSGKNRTLTNNNNVTLGSGKIGGDAVLNGTNCLSLNGYSFENKNFTLSFWYYPVSTYESTYGGIIDTRSPGSGASGFYFGYNQTANTVDLWCNNNFQDMSIELALGEWNHITISKLGDIFTIYLNGVEAATKTFSVNFTNNQMIIGNTMDDFYVTGEIDEIALWSRALSTAEVAKVYNTNRGLGYSSF